MFLTSQYGYPVVAGVQASKSQHPFSRDLSWPSSNCLFWSLCTNLSRLRPQTNCLGVKRLDPRFKAGLVWWCNVYSRFFHSGTRLKYSTETRVLGRFCALPCPAFLLSPESFPSVSFEQISHLKLWFWGTPCNIVIMPLNSKGTPPLIISVYSILFLNVAFSCFLYPLYFLYLFALVSDNFHLSITLLGRDTRNQFAISVSMVVLSLVDIIC